MAESFWNYLMRITDNASGVAISRAAEVDAGNVSRWKTGKTSPSAESVVKIARVWGRSPTEALVASGHLEADEVGGVVEVARGPAELSDDELLAEIRERMEARHAVEDDEEPRTSGEAVEDEKTDLVDDQAKEGPSVVAPVAQRASVRMRKAPKQQGEVR